MEQNQKGLSDIPKNFTELECYSVIYNFHKKYGSETMSTFSNLSEAKKTEYSDLINALPAPDEATSADRDFVFGQCLSHRMEGVSYRGRSDDDIVIALYARYALDSKYEKGLDDDDYKNNRTNSMLYPKFKD